MNKICPRQHDIYIGFHDVTSKVLMKAFLKIVHSLCLHSMVAVNHSMYALNV